MQDVTVSTPSLTMALASVESESAANATEGAWTTNWRGDVSEVPPDGTHQYTL